MPEEYQRSPTMGTPQRPKDPTELLLDRDIPALWQARNFKANRFSVVNLDLVIGEIGLEHTTSKKYFDRAREQIESENWNDLYRFEYSCSHTQIYPQNRGEARQFGHAATQIVALELAARDLRPTYNVYERLRILPITYFVDLFDREHLDKARSQNRNFDDACLAALGHEYDRKLLDQHSWGMTLTKAVAEDLLAYLDANVPDVKVGPVRCVGDPLQRSAALGKKNRATDLSFVSTMFEVPPLGHS